MSINSRRDARIKREKMAIWKQLSDHIANDDPYQYDPKYKRLAEICKERHLPFSEAWSIVEKEFAEK